MKRTRVLVAKGFATEGWMAASNAFSHTKARDCEFQTIMVTFRVAEGVDSFDDIKVALTVI